MILPPASAPGLDQCVLPLLESLGWEGNLTTLAEFLPSQPGWTPAELMDCLGELGWDYLPGRFGWKKAGQPLLVRDRKGTYWCIEGRSASGWRVYRPDSGWEELSPKEFRRAFRGAWTFSFVPAAPDPDAKTSPFWIQDLVSRNRGALGAVLLYSLFLAGFGILSPQFIGLLYQEITSMNSSSTLLYLGLGALLFAAGEVMFLTLRQSLLTSLRGRISESLGKEILRRILGFPLVFGLNLEPAAQYSRIKEFEELADVLSRPVFRSMVDLPFMTILLVFLGLTGGTMVLVPVVTIVLFLLGALFAHPLLKKLEQDAAAATQQVQESLDVVTDKARDLRALALTEHWKARGREAETRGVPALLEKGKTTALFQFFGSAAVSLAGIAAVLAGISEVLAGALQPGALMASMMLVWRILDPFRSVFVLLGSLETASQTLGRLGKFMAIPGEDRLDPSRPALHLPHPSVRVDGFYFKYPTSPRFALANLSLEVPAFGSVHIGGPAGAGKTTLALALTGLLEGSSGRILVGDQNIRQYHSMTYRKALSYLPARVPIAPASLRDNLRFARADAEDDELLEVLDSLGLTTVVASLEEGLETVLGNRFRPPTTDFYRGIGLARVLLRPAKLWILDAPEQGLGPGLKGRFLDLLRQQQDKTIIVFGSDPDFAAWADRRAWIDQGRLLQEAP